MKQSGLTAPDGLKQACGNTRPAPELDGGSPGRRAELRARFGGKNEQLVQLCGEVGRITVLETRQVLVLRGILGFQALRDLREPRVASDERRRARSRRLRRD